VTESSRAVFLSYASQDAEAAQRICEALRAAAIEVWFDQSELRGGDAWDQMIRKQIKTCAIFIPVISRHTHERRGGYFRLGRNLAVDRSRLISTTQAFLVPVVIDDTREDDEEVPEFASCMDYTLMNELKQLSGSARAAIEAKGSWSTSAENRSGRTETAPETSVVAVSIADLDLSSSEGVRIAQERIHKAARRICSQLADSQDPSHSLKCMNDTTTAALRQIHEAALAAN